MKYDIFISYSRKDSKVVKSVVDRLMSEGYSCWMDVSGIESGDAFKGVLVQAIKNSKTVLFFASENSNSSEWTVKEINIAVQLKKPIIPVRLDSSPYDDSVLFDLSALDFITLNDFDRENSLTKLLRGIEHWQEQGSRGSTNVIMPQTMRKLLHIAGLALIAIIVIGSVYGTFLYCKKRIRLSSAMFSLPMKPKNHDCATILLPGGVPLDMIYVEPDEFMMGADETLIEVEKPVHKVKLTKGFWMGKCEVTQRQWCSLMESNPSHFKGDNYPIENISWIDATNFCGRLNQAAKDTGVILSGGKFRLPTEAEWEYACRAGTSGDYAGNIEELSWHLRNSEGGTHQVGMKRANPWGFYDMLGNVWEWCWDYFDSAYYANSEMRDPKGPTRGIGRVFRGGAFDTDGQMCRSSVRNAGMEDRYCPMVGLRICCPRITSDDAASVSNINELPNNPKHGENISISLSDQTEMELIYLKPGTFVMGTDNGREDERPAHEVEISKGFWIGKTEVTQKEWREIMGAKKKDFQDATYKRLLEPGFGLTDEHKEYYPAEAVSWEDATNFCAKLTERMKRRGHLYPGYVYRLPYEAEWEYACMSGATVTDTNHLENVTWYRDNSNKKLHLCGSKAPNAWGLYDMNGNVSEWCMDWYDKKYYEMSPKRNPKGCSSGKSRVVRGGNIKDDIFDCVGVRRKSDSPSNYLSRFGFRVVLAPEENLESDVLQNNKPKEKQ